MEANENTIKLYYNTEVEKLAMPEYGRNVLKMVEIMKGIEDRAKRSEQARAIVEQKLWDHLYMIAGYDLDIDAPYPAPHPEVINSRPDPIPLNTKPIKARHYGRNIESIIDLIASEPDGEVKTAMIRSLAIYMRQQYLIWNKDTVADETIFADIERLSGGRVTVPEGLELSKIDSNANFSRPGMNMGFNRNGGNNGGGKKQWVNYKKNGKKK